MTHSASADFPQPAGPQLTAVPLRPVAVHFQVEPTPPVAPPVKQHPPAVAISREHTFAEIMASENRGTSINPVPFAAPRKRLFLDISSEITRPFEWRKNSKEFMVGFLSLALFFVWLGYWAVPGLSEAMPLGSVMGFVYLATVIPGSLFLAAVVLAIGKALGWCLERIAQRMT